MSALGEMIRGYEKQIQILAEALEQIKIMPYKSDKPYELVDAVQVACQALKKSKAVFSSEKS
ncbi:MAG: hypothetical protein Q8934_10725 [Bacillota bacterium]|nr:hypothetical protein [Bacillota bacterium]